MTFSDGANNPKPTEEAVKPLAARKFILEKLEDLDNHLRNYNDHAAVIFDYRGSEVFLPRGFQNNAKAKGLRIDDIFDLLDLPAEERENRISEIMTKDANEGEPIEQIYNE